MSHSLGKAILIAMANVFGCLFFKKAFGAIWGTNAGKYRSMNEALASR